MSIFKQSIDAIYRSHIGTDAVLTGVNGVDGDVAVRAVDKTAGLEIPAGEGVEVPTVLPAACVRVKELAAAGVTQASQLLRATITMNDEAWTIIRTMERRTPHGKGEWALILREANG